MREFKPTKLHGGKIEPLAMRFNFPDLGLHGFREFGDCIIDSTRGSISDWEFSTGADPDPSYFAIKLSTNDEGPNKRIRIELYGNEGELASRWIDWREGMPVALNLLHLCMKLREQEEGKEHDW